MTVRLYVNRGSRSGERALEETKAALEARQIVVEDARLVVHAGLLRSLVARAEQEGVDAVVVGGGDGTVNLAASQLAETQTPLGIVPLGTGNALARDLGIPLTLDGSADVIARGNTLAIDVGRLGDQVFVNVATVGVTTDIANSLDASEKRLLGRLAYVPALARAIATIRPFRLTLTIDEERHELESVLVVVGVGRTHAGPFPVTPDASPTDGKLNVYAVQGNSWLGLAGHGLGLALGRHTDLTNVHAGCGTKVEIVTRPRRRVVVDGEPSLRTPVTSTVVPAGLTVFVP